MEIGPITGIRPIAMSSRVRSADDLSAVFQTEFRKHGGDETYSPSEDQAEGRFEEEELEAASFDEDLDEAPRPMAAVSRGSGISFFA